MDISINEITSGLALRVDGQIFFVTEYSHVKPGKGAAFVRVRLKNIKTDLVIEKTFRSADKLENVFLEEKEVQYLYRSGDVLHFMDQETFEEIVVSEENIGEGVKYLQDNLDVTAIFCDHKLAKIVLPNFIIANIVETEPGFKGDTSKAGTKSAKIDTGATIQVPLFINVGDWVKIDTRTGEYVERVQR
jgi:elongation factor P